MQELIEKWKERLKRFQENPDVAKDMNSMTELGVQHGRTISLRDCIRELEEFVGDETKEEIKAALK